jgi:hypothetical protein
MGSCGPVVGAGAGAHAPKIMLNTIKAAVIMKNLERMSSSSKDVP